MMKTLSTRFVIIVLVFMGITVYANSLKGDFVWDDQDFIVRNDFIKSLKNVPSFFTNKETLAAGKLGGDNYRPLVSLTYALDYASWKLNPLGYHIMNTGLHITNAILLFYLLSLITKDRFLSFFSAIIFLVHPLQTEAVTWISGRSNVLFLFFFLISFIAYIEYKNIKHWTFYLASLLFFSFGLLSKETTVVLPFMLLLYDRLYGDRKEDRPGVVSYAPFFIVIALYLFVRFAVLGRFSQCDYWTGSLYTTLLTMSRVIAYYIRLFVYPVGLCVDYLKFPASYSIRDYRVILSLLFITIIVLSGFVFRKRMRHLSFGIFWFFIALLPVMNIVPVKIFMAERFLYMPLAGLAIALAAIFAYLYKMAKKNVPMAYFLVFSQIALVLACSTLTIARNTDWRDAVVLYGKAIEKYPDNFRAHYNLALTYGKRGEDAKAFAQLREVTRLKEESQQP